MIAFGLQMLVMVMMVAVGLEVSVDQLKDGLKRIKWLVAALVLNLVVVPTAVWLFAQGVSLPLGMTAGLVLLAAAPAGPIGPILSRLSHSNLGFSTGLMVMLGVVGLLSTPITVGLLLDIEGERQLLILMFSVLLVSQIVPLAIAMGVAARFPEAASLAAMPFRVISNALLIVVVLALVLARGELLTTTSWTTHLALVGGLFILVAPMLILSPPSSAMRSLLTITAVRNMSVALFLATQFFEDPMVEATILLWSFWMLAITGVIGSIAGHYRTAWEFMPARQPDSDDAPLVAPAA